MLNHTTIDVALLVLRIHGGIGSVDFMPDE